MTGVEGSGYWRRAEALLEEARGMAAAGDYSGAVGKCREAVDLALTGLLAVAGHGSAAPASARGIVTGDLVRRGWLKEAAARQLADHLEELELIFGPGSNGFSREEAEEALWEAGWVLDLTFAAALPRLLAEEGVEAD
ncbi:MAG: HEPN domain-containing protein [Firmicutes bacterium]|nr:HEPN domain-containing protein [Bacillota bacterium]